jgi:hypothetical protein
MTTELTRKIKSELWRCYGNPSFPAEWDGKIYGGGKISQRFWEYHQTIEMLDLTPDSVVLDIGGGSPVTGAGFFTRVISPHVKEVHVLDTNIGTVKEPAANLVFHKTLANYETLSKLLREKPQITHIACISVFEHIVPDVRCGIVKAVNDHFSGTTFVSTVEYHARDCFFEYQLTARTLSELFEPLTNLYLDKVCSSPVLGEPAYRNVSFSYKVFRRLGLLRTENRIQPGVPRWYPLALKFRRRAS